MHRENMKSERGASTYMILLRMYAHLAQENFALTRPSNPTYPVRLACVYVYCKEKEHWTRKIKIMVRDPSIPLAPSPQSQSYLTPS